MSSNSETKWLAAAFAVAAIFSSGTAAAEDKKPASVEQARALFKAGAEAYSTGKYAAAIQAFDEAYRLSRRDGLLFSIAQAHRRLYFVSRRPEHLRSAIDYYRRYLKVAAEGPRRGEAADALAQLEPVAKELLSDAAVTADAPPAAVSSQLMITSPVRAASLLLDGKDAGRLPFISEVKPGKHLIEIRAAGFETYRREVSVAAGQIVPLDVPLMEKTAQLSIVAPAGARVWINGQNVGVAPLAPLTLRPGGYTVSVGANGYRTDTKRLELGRAEHGTFSAEIGMTTQRKIAWGTIATGGALLVVGVVLGAVAISRQNQAEAWLDRRGDTELIGADLDRYHGLKDDQVRLRTAALATGGAGAALAIAGVTLFLLDQPPPPSGGAYEQSVPPVGTDPPAGSEAPMEVSLGAGGLRVRARF